MIFYLTFNDGPSGIFSSQVIDVVKFIRKELKENIKLVSFISLRGFSINRKKIKKELPDAIVVPMFPGLKNWRKNSFLLNLLIRSFKPRTVIARSVLASELALSAKEKTNKFSIVYDGRGAIAAEWEEYKVVNNATLLNEISTLENSAINKVDFRIAVSNELVKHWQHRYNYLSSRHVVIPCTLNTIFSQLTLTTEVIKKRRESLGFKPSDIVFAYSGSLAGWQSFELVHTFLKKVMEQDSNIKLLFLSDHDPNIAIIEKEFKGRIIRNKVTPAEVPNYLLAADYGMLIREESLTNKVASPVKFAEYLACGLPVIISKQLGDYSQFVKEHNCGFIYTEPGKFIPVSFEEKIKIKNLAMKYFSKEHYLQDYKLLINT